MIAFCIVALVWVIYEMTHRPVNEKNPQRGELMFPEDK